MPSFKNIFHEVNPELYFNDYLNGAAPLKDCIYNQSPQLDILFASDTFNPSDRIHSYDRSWFLKIRNRFRSDISNLRYDLIIFDMTPGLQLFALSMMTLSDYLLIILRADYQSFFGTQKLVKNFYSRVVPKIGTKVLAVINQVPDVEEMDSLIEEWQTIYQNSLASPITFVRVNYDKELAYNAARQLVTYIPPDVDQQLVEFFNNGTQTNLE